MKHLQHIKEYYYYDPYNNVVEYLELDVIQEIMSQYYDDANMTIAVEFMYEDPEDDEVKYDDAEIKPGMRLLEHMWVEDLRIYISFSLSRESTPEEQQEILQRIKQMTDFPIGTIRHTRTGANRLHIDPSDNWHKKSQDHLIEFLFRQYADPHLYYDTN